MYPQPELTDVPARRALWWDASTERVWVIDQTDLPARLTVIELETADDAAQAICTMRVRGAPLIGAVAAYGLALGFRRDSSRERLESTFATLLSTRPTAVNLRHALESTKQRLLATAPALRFSAGFKHATELAETEIRNCEAIGRWGLDLLTQIWKNRGPKSGDRLNVLTHCNAGWLATIGWGTALAPIYRAFDEGIPIHVWVDETRPRNQGSRLTAWELSQSGIPCTVIVDNAGGHLMQHGKVDLCLVGSDCTTRRGDVCNKIGTYLKALAAHDTGVPFYAAVPSSSIDWTREDGIEEIPIEERSEDEVHFVEGLDGRVQVTPVGTRAANFGFDVTPARLLSGIITERGVARPDEGALGALFPEFAGASSGIEHGA